MQTMRYTNTRAWQTLVFFVSMLIFPLLTLALFVFFWNSYENAIIRTAIIDGRAEADAIVIFGAATAAGGQPGAILRSRINHALTLYREGLAKCFILTGGIGWEPPAESAVMKRILSENGVCDSHIFFETQSTATREQVEFAAEVAQKNNWSRLLIVSDPYHLYRISRYFSGTGLMLFLSPATGVTFNTKETNEYIRAEILKLIAWEIFGT